jgi:hypothetical protein
MCAITQGERHGVSGARREWRWRRRDADDASSEENRGSEEQSKFRPDALRIGAASL